jgi:hypothetical protein
MQRHTQIGHAAAAIGCKTVALVFADQRRWHASARVATAVRELARRVDWAWVVSDRASAAGLAGERIEARSTEVGVRATAASQLLRSRGDVGQARRHASTLEVT